MSDTLQQVLSLRRSLLTNVRSIIELASPLMKVGFSPSLSSVRSSTKNASKSHCPLLFVSLLPHSTAQALKSPAMTTVLRSLACSTIWSSILSNSSWGVVACSSYKNIYRWSLLSRMLPQDCLVLLRRDVYHKPRWLLSSPRQSFETDEVPVFALPSKSGTSSGCA